VLNARPALVPCHFFGKYPYRRAEGDDNGAGQEGKEGYQTTLYRALARHAQGRSSDDDVGLLQDSRVARGLSCALIIGADLVRLTSVSISLCSCGSMLHNLCNTIYIVSYEHIINMSNP